MKFLLSGRADSVELGIWGRFRMSINIVRVTVDTHCCPKKRLKVSSLLMRNFLLFVIYDRESNIEEMSNDQRDVQDDGLIEIKTGN